MNYALFRGCLELLQETDIVLEIEADVIGTVLEHGHAFDSEAEGETAVFGTVDTAVFQDVGIHHAAAENLDPTGVFAKVAACAAADVAGDVHFRGWFREREVRGTQTNANLIAEHTLREIEQSLLHIGK